MTYLRLVLPVTLLVGLTTPLLGQAPPVHFKELAGPPTEFGAMAPANPAASAIRSKNALLPIVLREGANSAWVASLRVPVEADQLSFILVPQQERGSVASWRVSLSGSPAQPLRRVLVPLTRGLSLGIAHEGIVGERYEVESMLPGMAELHFESDAPGRGYLVLAGSETLKLESSQVAFNQRVGERIAIRGHAYDDSAGKGAPRILSAALRIIDPEGRAHTRRMFDDGRHSDGQPGDGVYGGDFLADRPGQFVAQAVLSGSDWRGVPFVRSAEHLIPVVEDGLRLMSASAEARLVRGHRLEVRLRTSSPSRGHYRVVAQIWGTRDSEWVPVSWIGGMVRPRDGVIGLRLDTRWIQRAGAEAPFELRELRIEDPDYFITVASVARMRLRLPRLPTARGGVDVAIDEEMLMGPRPANLLTETGATDNVTGKAYDSGSGHRLLLIHGYCSSDVWGPVSGQFSNDSVFLDLGQNRTHDEFANRILTFGNAWNSYAIVAHSQGGAAALQLYAHYWSGLDNAGPGRLLQSVGTPYQGTNIAGIFATLGSWFGVGCGSNANLTYSGSASWLAGIPSSYRAKVNYFTTSFTDDFGIDYCHAVTDALLTDPDDGVVERAWAQLPGGVNQGHKTGWCHSAGMRDPAQTTDSARNASMSSNAAVGCYRLTRTHSGAGADPVATPGNSTGCASGRYVSGASIQLQASPSAGWRVGGWSGTANNSSTSTSNSVTMPSADRTVSVTYEVIPPTCYQLTRTHSGSGSDPVATPPSSSGCSSGRYVAGASIQLQASPATGWRVGGWSGTANNSSTSTSNSLIMPAGDHTVSVTYEVIPPTCYQLTRTHSGSGADPVASPTSSSGCSSGRYVAGASIQLQAAPSAGWSVSSWTGTSNNASTSTANSLSMPAGDWTVGVNYQATPPSCFTLTRNHTGSGSDPVGSPTSSSGCSSGQYLAGATVQLQAAPAAGWSVASWSGTSNDSSTSASNSVVMPASPRTVIVNYAAVPPVCHTLTRAHTGSGLDPVATPASSNGCAAGSYIAGATIQLQASPATGWSMAGWTGTIADSSTSTSNSTVMPSAAHTVVANYSAGSERGFHTVTPCRVLDTRIGGGSPLASGSLWELGISGFCGIPETAVAISGNLTVVAPTGPGFVVIWSAQAARPMTSNINFSAGQTRANNVIFGTALGYFGNPVALWITPALSGTATVHVVLDVNGYFD